MTHKKTAILISIAFIIGVVAMKIYSSTDRPLDNVESSNDDQEEPAHEDQISVSNLNDRVAHLEKEIALLIRTMESKLSLPRQAEAPDTEGFLTEEEKLERATSARLERLGFYDASINNSLRSGKRDDNFENEVLSKFSQAEFSLTNVTDLSCDSTMCRMKVTSSSSDENEEMPMKLSELGIIEGEGYFTPPEETDENTFETIVYFSRSGQLLPSLQDNR